MANTFIKMQKLAELTAGALRANRVASMAIMKGEELDSSFFSGKYADKGDSMKIGYELEFIAKEHNEAGNTADDIVEESTDIKLDKMFTIDKSISSFDLTTMDDRKMGEIALAAAEGIDQAIDTYLVNEMVRNAQGFIPQPATITINDLLALGNYLDLNNVSVMNRSFLLDPNTKASILGIDKVLDAAFRADGGAAFKNAQVGNILGLLGIMTQNAKSYSTGNSTLAVNGAVALNSLTIGFDGGTACNMVAGDIITIGADKYIVKDIVWLSAGVSGTITVSTPVKTAILDNAVLNYVHGSGALVIQRSAMVWGMRPLKPAEGGALSYTAISRDGYSIRTTIDYDIMKKKSLISFDVLVGAKVLRPQAIVRFPKLS